MHVGVYKRAVEEAIAKNVALSDVVDRALKQYLDNTKDTAQAATTKQGDK